MKGSGTEGTSRDLELGKTVDERGATVALDAVPKWLGDRYRIVRVLGEGGMGAVYLAVDEALVCEVALKMIAPEVARSTHGLDRLRDEVRLAQKVTHPNVCRTYDLEDVGGNYLIKMEYIAGETLADRLKKGPIPVAEAVRVATKVRAGLAAAHEQGVVHRDLKPHNIMLEAPTGRVLLMDFGIARAAALAGKTAENVSGTPDYMAPEQVRGREVDGRADLYALGCVIYEMLVGDRVFPRSTPMAAALAHADEPAPALPASFPERLRRLVARLLEKDPSRRPASAYEVAAALAGPPRRGRLGAVLALLVLAFGGMGFVVWRTGRLSSDWRPVLRELRPGSEEEIGWPVFSPDSRSIAYASNRSGAWRIYVDALADGSSRVIGSPLRPIYGLRWARDGRSLLYGEFDPVARSYRIPVDGGPSELLADGRYEPEDCGVGLLFVSGDPNCPACVRIVLREADGRERDVFRRSFGDLTTPHCDSAGKRVVFGVVEDGTRPEHAHLWITQVDGKGGHEVHPDASGASIFSPDGDSILVALPASNGRNLWELPLSGQPASQITFGEGFVAEPDVSPDGRTLVVLASPHKWSWPLYASSLSGGSRRRLTSTAEALTHLSMTSDGQQIIAAADRDGVFSIVAVSTSDGEERTLAQGDVAVLSPDGGEIIYSVPGKPTRILAMPRQGGPSRTITTIARRVTELAVGLDGTLHLGLTDEAGIEAWRAPLAGGDAEREAPPPWTFIVPAPTGGWRVAVDRNGVGHIVRPGAPLDDPAAHLFRDFSTMTWDVNGASILYYSNWKIHRVWVATGEDVVLFDEDQFRGGIALSPDGSTIYFGHYFWPRHALLITNFGDRPRPH